MSVEQAREAAVDDALSRIRKIEQEQGATRASLNDMRDVLYQLAERKELFPREDFPPPADGTMNIRYTLSTDTSQGPWLYMNSIMPGKRTLPHNHKTWAVVVSVEGDERNRFYDRTDGGSGPGGASLVLSREVVVAPGVGVTLMPDDIHSIEVEGEQPTLHLHMYGRAIESLTDRLGFDLEAGTCDYYKLQGRTA
ncbi:MAG: cysteine dioxygenase family protein [Gammaproteobacteria bacterium]|nr:cysteine dioxygenase family protein [Gammaproteobacteria bacterium]